MHLRVLTALLVLAALCLTPALGQIPNPGFENWDVNGEPVGWTTNNASGFYTTIIKSTIFNSGTAALRGQVDSAQFVGLVAPWVWSGNQGEGFHVAVRHAEVTGYYQFNSVGGDQLYVTGWMLKGDTALVASMATFLPATSTAYTVFNAPFNYYYWYTHEVPDSCFFAFTVAPAPGQTTVHKGTYFLIDDLAFSGISGVAGQESVPLVFGLDQNYPNPFNPSTTIGYDLPQRSNVSLIVFNTLGQKVADLLNGEIEAGHHEVQLNASSLASGVYFYRLRAGSFVDTKKLIVVK